MKSSIFPVALLALSLSVVSCGGGESDNAPAATEPQTETPEASTPEHPESIEVTVEGNDQMQFSINKIEVFEGQQVTIVFKNVGELPVETMGHNFTLLAKGVDHMEYGTAAMSHKDNAYQVPGRENDVIVHTALLGPGESETLEFTAPSKGIYKFVCTFPGHAGLMNGTFLVR